MSYFTYKNGSLHAESADMADIAQQYQTPAFVYSRQAIENQWKAFDKALGSHPHLICYAVKANSNIGVLNVLARLGSGFDIVSVGELERVIAAGGDPKKVVFSGVGKKRIDIERALEVGIHCFNVESQGELERIAQAAKSMKKVAPISIRVNPDVDAQTHPYISTGLKENKFGIDINVVAPLYEYCQQSDYLDPVGVDCHIGSQLTTLSPFQDALERVLDLVTQLQDKGITLKHLDLGGGLGICYDDEVPPTPQALGDALLEKLADLPYDIILEPGRAIVGNAGVLLMEVEFLKENGDHNFAVVDAAMNDNIRPALYQAWQKIIPVQDTSPAPSKVYDIVGPICETGDFLGKQRELSIEPGDLLAMMSSGAYAASMSSNYNTRPRAAELLVDGDQVHVVRERESIKHLFVGEKTIP